MSESKIIDVYTAFDYHVEKIETLKARIEELEKYNTQMTDLADEAIYQLKGYIEQVYGPNISENDFKKWEYFWKKFCDIISKGK